MIPYSMLIAFPFESIVLEHESCTCLKIRLTLKLLKTFSDQDQHRRDRLVFGGLHELQGSRAID